MPLITCCKLYVDEKSTTTAASQEHARRLAIACINKRQAIKLEIGITSRPAQVWVCGYDPRQRVLQGKLTGT